MQKLAEETATASEQSSIERANAETLANQVSSSAMISKQKLNSFLGEYAS